VLFRGHHGEPLTHERRERNGPKLAVEASDPWSAPIDRTRSTLVVLHTPVTSAPNALAIWTA
jgi:hypothetical protein